MTKTEIDAICDALILLGGDDSDFTHGVVLQLRLRLEDAAQEETSDMKARRCETCKELIVPWDVADKGGVRHFCTSLDYYVDHPDDFACNRWAAREEEP